MSSYSYLKDHVKRSVDAVVQRVMQRIDLKEPPVPYGQLYDAAKLQINMFKKHHPDFLDFAQKVGTKKAESLRGVLFVEDRYVIVRDDGYDKRNNFAKGHEYGHWELPSHRDLLYKCSEFDLSPRARAQMEREANYFVSRLNCLGDKFFEYLSSSQLSITTIKGLSDLFCISVESAFRSAVECELRPCAFLSLEMNEEDSENFLSIRYPSYSESFKQRFGFFEKRQTFSREHELAKIVTSTIPSLLNSYEFTLQFGSDKKRTPLKTEVWKNPWNIFALCQPADP